jgi:hypothetical protein
MKQIDKKEESLAVLEREGSSERRLGVRHSTTIVVQDEESSGRVPVRGDINKDGYIFLPEFSRIEGQKLDLAIRLPGLGEWIECTGVVQAPAVRGNGQGIVSRIVETDEKNERSLTIWKRMSECSSGMRSAGRSSDGLFSGLDS